MEFTSACVVGAGRVGTVRGAASESVPTRPTGRERRRAPPTSSSCACQTASSTRSRPRSLSGRGSPTRSAPWTRSTRIPAASACTRSRPSSATGGPSSSTGPGPPSPARATRLGAAFRLAGLLRLRPFDAEDERWRSSTTRPRSVAQSFLVALHGHGIDGGGGRAAGCAPARVRPWRMTSSSPARSSAETGRRSSGTSRSSAERRPELEPMYRALTDMMAAAVAAR